MSKAFSVFKSASTRLMHYVSRFLSLYKITFVCLFLAVCFEWDLSLFIWTLMIILY